MSSHNFINLAGKKFTRLLVISRAENNLLGQSRWNCLCDCGGTVIVSSGHLIKLNTKSCGCLQVEGARERKTVHGMTNSRVYRIWTNMKTRCLNKADIHYKSYVGRGIKICDQWVENFEKFLSDMGTPPTVQHSINRVDNDGDYDPKNCVWATNIEQANNTRKNHVIEFNGTKRTLAQWADHTGINRSTLLARINKHGWAIERALCEPKNKLGWDRRNGQL